MPQLPERCLSRKAGIVRCCPSFRRGGITRPTDCLRVCCPL
ncbi:MAG: hypothetical protein ACLUZX_14250 [Subdoligranulum sp.]